MTESCQITKDKHTLEPENHGINKYNALFAKVLNCKSVVCTPAAHSVMVQFYHIFKPLSAKWPISVSSRTTPGTMLLKALAYKSRGLSQVLFIFSDYVAFRTRSGTPAKKPRCTVEPNSWLFITAWCHWHQAHKLTTISLCFSLS